MEIRDRVGGRADLEARVLRAIGEPADRFREDRLRLLRAVRLAAQLGFSIEPGTMAALKSLASGAADVAAERTRDELTRLLTGPDSARGLELLEETGLLEILLPEVARLRGVEQPPEFHPEGDVWTHTVLLFRHLESPHPELAWGALLHDVGKPPTFRRDADRIRFPSHARVGAEIADGTARRLRMSNDHRERIVALVDHHMRFLDVRNMKTSTLKRFLRLEAFDDHLALHRADCLASNGNLENWEYAQAKRAELGEKQLRPARLVTGDDLIALGWKPGPGLGTELRRLEETQLDGALRTREEALGRAREDLTES
jgi:poly(A) polymerase